MCLWLLECSTTSRVFISQYIDTSERFIFLFLNILKRWKSVSSLLQSFDQSERALYLIYFIISTKGGGGGRCSYLFSMTSDGDFSRNVDLMCVCKLNAILPAILEWPPAACCKWALSLDIFVEYLLFQILSKTRFVASHWKFVSGQTTKHKPQGFIKQLIISSQNQNTNKLNS
jgi:hypothetical protein